MRERRGTGALTKIRAKRKSKERYGNVHIKEAACLLCLGLSQSVVLNQGEEEGKYAFQASVSDGAHRISPWRVSFCCIFQKALLRLRVLRVRISNTRNILFSPFTPYLSFTGHLLFLYS